MDLKTNGSKRTKEATSKDKLKTVIEEMARFVGNISRDNRFKSKNALCNGFSITQPILSKHFEMNGIKIHHNVVHDIINKFCIRDHSYCNSDTQAHIYTKTTIDWDNQFKYIIDHLDDFNNHDLNHFKLNFLKQNPNFKITINRSLSTETLTSITINNHTFETSSAHDNDNIAIIGKLNPKYITDAIKQTNVLIKKAQQLKTPIIKNAKIIRLNKNKEWLENCLYNDGLYLDLYKLSSCGRQYGLGTTIQNINREIRRKLLKSHTAYDQRGSHLNILVNKALDKGLEVNNLMTYLNMNEIELQQLIKESKMHRKSFKLTILSIINGYKGDKVWRHKFLSKLFMEITNLQKQLQYTSKDLFETERHLTQSKINEIGMENILSLEFDGFTAITLPNQKNDKLWKIKKL
jgi:hypothetical protein